MCVNYFLTPLFTFLCVTNTKLCKQNFRRQEITDKWGAPPPFTVIYRLKYLTTQRKKGDLTKHCVTIRAIGAALSAHSVRQVGQDGQDGQDGRDGQEKT